MNELVVIVAFMVAFWGIVFGGIFYAISLFKRLKARSPKLHRIITFMLGSLVFLSLGVGLSFVTYFYFVNLSNSDDIRNIEALRAGLQHLQQLLEADANIFGGRFLLALTSFVFLFLGTVISFILIFILPLMSLVLILTPIFYAINLKEELFGNEL